MFDEEQNWANSEVMKIFAENFLDRQPVETIVAPVVEMPAVEPVLVAPVNDVAAYEAKIAALSQIDDTLRGLKRIAGEKAAAGKIKEAYEIERTIEEVKEIGLQILGEANV